MKSESAKVFAIRKLAPDDLQLCLRFWRSMIKGGPFKLDAGQAGLRENIEFLIGMFDHNTDGERSGIPLDPLSKILLREFAEAIYS